MSTNPNSLISANGGLAVVAGNFGALKEGEVERLGGCACGTPAR
jgi:hypothetical protein